MEADSGFWNRLGPIILACLGAVIAAVYLIFKDDIRWLKRNVTNILIHLGLKAEE